MARNADALVETPVKQRRLVERREAPHWDATCPRPPRTNRHAHMHNPLVGRPMCARTVLLSRVIELLRPRGIDIGHGEQARTRPVIRRPAHCGTRLAHGPAVEHPTGPAGARQTKRAASGGFGPFGPGASSQVKMARGGLTIQWLSREPRCIGTAGSAAHDSIRQSSRMLRVWYRLCHNDPDHLPLVEAN